MKVTIDGDPTIIAQFFQVMSWLNTCGYYKGISEFKIRVDNTDKNFNLNFNIEDPILKKQFEQFCNLYNKYNTTQLNTIFRLGIPFGILNQDVVKVKEQLK